MIRHHALRRGWTLIEMLVVMMCLTVLLSLIASVMWAVFRVQEAATSSFENLQSEARLADRFRADVAGARESPELVADFKADPLCLLLRGEDGALIVYRLVQGRVDRTVMRPDGSETDSFRVGGAEVVGEFSRQGRMMTLTLHGAKRGTLTITAALGGDRQ